MTRRPDELASGTHELKGRAVYGTHVSRPLLLIARGHRILCTRPFTPPVVFLHALQTCAASASHSKASLENGIFFTPGKTLLKDNFPQSESTNRGHFTPHQKFW
jgi:hypothetical protein